MIHLDVTDEPINLRPDTLHGGNYPTWGLSIGGKPIGTVWETQEGYAGQIQGEDGQGTHVEYECPTVTFRDTVLEQLGKKAEEIGLVGPVKVKGWVIEGKYTSGRGSEWEELAEVRPTDVGGPGDSLTGKKYADWLRREHQTAAPYGQHRVRSVTFDA